jgi:hypothetical protein
MAEQKMYNMMGTNVQKFAKGGRVKPDVEKGKDEVVPKGKVMEKKKGGSVKGCK